MALPHAMTASFRRHLRRHIGLWRLLEWRNKALLTPAALRWWFFETAEVRRLGRGAVRLKPPARVTVVLPTYRRPVGVEAAVRSVLAQTVDDLELVVVDDGGHQVPPLPDDPRLRVVHLSRNTGIAGVVRNVGIRLTDGRCVAFLDDDNTWRPDHLDVVLSELDRGAGLVYTAVERHRPDGTVMDTLSTPFDRRRLADESFVDMNSVGVRRGRRTRFSRIPRRKELLPREDWEFVHRLSGTTRAVHDARTTVDYLVNPGSYFTDWADGQKPQ